MDKTKTNKNTQKQILTHRIGNMTSGKSRAKGGLLIMNLKNSDNKRLEQYTQELLRMYQRRREGLSETENVSQGNRASSSPQQTSGTSEKMRSTKEQFEDLDDIYDDTIGREFRPTNTNTDKKTDIIYEDRGRIQNNASMLSEQAAVNNSAANEEFTREEDTQPYERLTGRSSVQNSNSGVWEEGQIPTLLQDDETTTMGEEYFATDRRSSNRASSYSEEFLRESRYNRSTREDWEEGQIPTLLQNDDTTTMEQPPFAQDEDSSNMPNSYMEEFLRQNPSNGFIKVQAYSGQGALPVKDVRIRVTKEIGGDEILFLEDITDESGKTEAKSLPAPDASLSQQPNQSQQPLPYATYTLTAENPSYTTLIKRDLPIFPGVISIQPLEMLAVPNSGWRPPIIDEEEEPNL